MSTGVLYIAFGQRFVDEALFSAETLKRHSDLPATLFTDADVTSPHLDDVRRIEPAHKRAKVDFIAQSPFERTLYLDSDTMVTHDLSDVFGILDRFDVAAVHDHSRKSSRWSKVVPEYAAIPYAFPEYNSGVLLFRRSEATDALFGIWREVFYRYADRTIGQDQASFRVALWQSDVRIHSLPFEYNVRNMAIRQKMERRAQQPDDAALLAPRILHWHGVGRAGWRDRLSRKHRPIPF